MRLVEPSEETGPDPDRGQSLLPDDSRYSAFPACIAALGLGGTLAAGSNPFAPRRAIAVPDQLPSEVADLLHAEASAARDAAWERFVATHTRLLLHVARTLVHDSDVVMDAYADLLERLREDDARRLRGFAAEGRSKFTTWLVVVSRRLCVDWLRHRGGRTRAGQHPDHPASGSQVFRRRLLGMAGEPIPLDTIRDASRGADADLERAEIRDALSAALDRLATTDRLLLALRFDDGLKAAEIAKVMRLPSPFHVYRRLDQVLRALRKSLNGSGVDSAV